MNRLWNNVTYKVAFGKEIKKEFDN